MLGGNISVNWEARMFVLGGQKYFLPNRDSAKLYTFLYDLQETTIECIKVKY